MKLILFIIGAIVIFPFVVTGADRYSGVLPSFLKGRANGAWVAARRAKVRSRASSSASVVWSPTLGDPVEVKGREGRWAKVSRDDGKKGWIESRNLSVTWIVVQKKKRRFALMEGLAEKGKWRIDLGPNPVGDKVMEGDLAPGHYRTPEGEMYVCRKVPNSKFYKAYLLSYPTIAHAKRGLEKGLINNAQYRSIVRAINNRGVPPQNTKLGSYIEIHGNGTGGLYDWTLGCIAVRNKVMDILWPQISVGTPVVVVP